MEKWTVSDSRVVLDSSPYMIVRQETCHLPNGVVIPDYNVISEPDIVLAFVLTPENKLVLVEQYKHGIGQVCLELPGGLSDGATALEEIQREVLEETGYQAPVWQHLSSYINNPTRFDNRIHSFIARAAQQVSAQKLDPAEDISVHTMPIPDVLEAVQKGTIASVHSVATILHALTTLEYWQGNLR